MLTTYGVIAGMKHYHHEEVVMEVVVESYLVFPRASEGPLCILGTPRYKTFG